MHSSSSAPEKRKADGPAALSSLSSTSSSSSSSPSKPSSSKQTSQSPLRLKPPSTLENSFARARELDQLKRQRTQEATSSSSLLSSTVRNIYDNTHSTMSALSTSSSSSSSAFQQSGKNGLMQQAPVVRRSGIQGKQPVKKLTIKNFTDTPQLPKNYEVETWKVLQQAVIAIQESKPVASSLEELYKTCENLCHQKLADSLYKKLSAQVEVHVNKIVTDLKLSASKVPSGGRGTPDQRVFLERVHVAWTGYCEQMIMIRSIFLYLDRTFVLQTSGVSSIWEMGLELWKRLVMDLMEIRAKVMEGLLGLIVQERNGEAVPKSLILSLLSMLTEVRLYASVFEVAFLDDSRLYYHAEGDQRVHSDSPAQYLRHVQKRLQEESTRYEGYLDKSTRKQLVGAVEDELLRRWMSLVLQSGFDSMMAERSIPDLVLLFDLSKRIGVVELLSVAFGTFVKDTGKALVVDPSRDDHMVEALLKFKMEMDQIVSESFQHSDLFLNVLKECFESFINTRQNKPAELVAKYLDLRLRSGNKELSDEDLETTLDRVLILFRYIQGKDIFEAFYKRDLAKRLLLNKSASFDAEKSMLGKLKAECGSGFTTKLEGMFKDMDISKDIMANFKSSKLYSKVMGAHLELSVNVLTQGNWPTYAPAEANIPTTISQCQEVFKEFYLSKHGGRRLMWQNSLGHCVVKAYFPKGNKDLQLSLFQGLVVLLFNDLPMDTSELTFTEIQQLSNIENRELVRTLQSLACGKYRVLAKVPKSKEVLETDRFHFNQEFVANLSKIKINAIQLKETAEENTSTNERVFQDRQFQVDAAIVRIMKTRKQLSHQLLIGALFDQLKFAIKPADLKKRIESLMDRDYLERDASDQSLYKYVA